MTDITSASSSGAGPQPALAQNDTPDHRYEGGRRFHAAEKVAYLLPDDVEEDDRLHGQHWVVKLAFGSNFDAPVQQALEEGTNVLDSACGPGTWTLEMANAFPNSKFYGTDISSRFPDQIKPGNAEFRVHNIIDPPLFGENYFGYIHQRLVILGIRKVDWPAVIQNLKSTLKPGGWLELTEFSYTETHNQGPVTKSINDISLKMMALGGLDPDLGSHLSGLLSDAGFTNVQTRTLDLVPNDGSKVGNLLWEDTKEAFKSAKPVYVKLDPKFEEPGVYEKCLEDMGEECKNYKSTIRWTRAIAQRPLESDI